jgi:uncharacterized phage protein (TIGR01671 family)
MSREIKFRIWDKKEKKLYKKVSRIAWSQDDQPDGYIFFIQATWATDEGFYTGMFSPEDVELMQYTGLKDRNSKEIYEGDVVVTQLNSPDGSKESLVVAFTHGAFKLKKEEDTYYYFPFLLDVEIIGNVYEHPELLNHVK